MTTQVKHTPLIAFFQPIFLQCGFYLWVFSSQDPPPCFILVHVKLNNLAVDVDLPAKVTDLPR